MAKVQSSDTVGERWWVEGGVVNGWIKAGERCGSRVYWTRCDGVYN